MRATVPLAALAALEAIFIVFLLTSDGTEPPPPAEPPPVDTGDRVPKPPEYPDGGDPRDEPEPPAATDTRACLYGRLIDADGKAPSGNGWVTLLPPGKQAFSARMGADGDYAHAGLRPGTYGLKVRVDGYDPIDDELIVSAGAETIRRDFELVKAIELAVRFLTPDGKPLLKELNKPDKAGAIWFATSLTAVATTESPGARLPGTLSSAWHRFGVGEFRTRSFRGGVKDDGRNGTLAIRGSLPVHVSACLRSEVLATVVLDEPKDSIEFRIDPQRIRDMRSGVTFRLTADGDEDPASKVLVDLSDQQTGSMGEKPERDGDRLVVRGKQPGQLLMTIWGGTAFEHYERVVDLPPSTIVDLGTIHLTSRVEFTGTVVDAEGKPVSGARITKYTLDRPWEEQRWSPMGAGSGADGMFTLWLGCRRYAIRASTRDGRRTVAEVDLTGGTPEKFRIVLPECQSVEVKPGKAKYPLLARIEDGDGRVMVSRTFTSAWPWNLRLPEGSYALVITREGRESARRPFSVVAGKEPPRLTLE